MVSILRTSSSNIEFQQLTMQLDRELRQTHLEAAFDYSKYNIMQAETKAVLLFENGKAIACGAFKEIDEENNVELKRIFVLPGFRGKGYSKKILLELETWAFELGFAYAKLETGIQQKTAIALYEKSNYQIIPNYPPYENIADSICFKKVLLKY